MFTPTVDGVYLDVHVQPGARRAAVLGRHGEALKVAVTVPPEGGKANRAVLALIAEHFDLPKRDVELVSGQSSRRKRLLLRGVKVEDLRVPD